MLRNTLFLKNFTLQLKNQIKIHYLLKRAEFKDGGGIGVECFIFSFCLKVFYLIGSLSTGKAPNLC